MASGLGVYQIANACLSRFPILKKIGDTEIVVKINSVAGLALAEEILGGAGYRPALEGYSIKTFVDLGCNVGWFPCLLAAYQFSENPMGIMVDGDPDVINSARWHLEKNNLTRCEIIHGVVGVSDNSNTIIFNINPSNTQSSIKKFAANHPFPLKGKVKEEWVPSLTLSKEWKSRFGETPIDLLKIDIEGAELEFLKKEIDFIISKVRRIVCEWHEWHVTLSEIKGYLESKNFVMGLILEKDEKGGVVIFDNEMCSVS